MKWKWIELHSKPWFWGSIAGIFACGIIAWWMAQPRIPIMTVYCAHDAVHAKEILEQFRKETKIKFDVVYDTEATKSLGLVERILKEKDNPICDVFWNNEVLGTLRLQEEQMLEPYKSPRHADVPDAFKDSTGFWTGFGARLRVYITDPNRLPAELAAIEQRLEAPDLSEVTIAKPLYGTTRTHYTALWQEWGPEKLKAWHQSLYDREIIEVSGNAVTSAMVGEGVCDLGFTDTDDFFVAKERGHQVAMVPARLPSGKVLCIPNSVCLIKNSDRPTEARALIDYILRAETEEKLAAAQARQIPLGPVDETRLPEEVRAFMPLIKEAVDIPSLRASAPDCLEWLKGVYAGG